MIGQIEELLKRLLGGNKPVSAVTRDLTEGSYLGDPISRTGVQTRPAQKSSKMSQETMDAFRELNQVLQSAARRDMPRKSFEGVNFEDVKQATPGLTVDAFAPVGDLGLIPDIAGEPKESRKWGAEKDEDLWSMIRRGLL